ncbi:hypothetical protein PENANT_c023G06831 [Penicillium antarcticum]|uniref:Uncharacterized protein n=1 Tax=Penicillium antarcticum TaxID=416450 RepID=A0A1V6PZ29_9EURO|nr:uncharacterized protein N7508_006145 [Penicillium antarcticum]KAJ5301282.1 hypothetical protein N7508_006145 [Penicillium antarcticum]OQD82195.1 hypothetical protein PENANT_c023G06831 [Penicillium antarcticum]
MPAPLAKGIIITVSVLVAAGIAVYESPQFKQWVTTSRRKIALALHNLGDEIQPRELAREDISMSEEVGEVAEERRRIARAEIMRRGTLMESRRKAQSDQALGSFDTLVDGDGNLRTTQDSAGTPSSAEGSANSTGVDIVTSEAVRRGGKQAQVDSSYMERDRLHLDIPSAPASNHPSESIIQFTPTSEAPDQDSLFDPFSPSSPLSASGSSGSSHTEDHQQLYYAHPHSAVNNTYQHDLLAELDDFGHGNAQSAHDFSAAPSTTGTFSHVGGFNGETSNGTLSDLGGRSVDGAATPASWSEVGSVISSEDAGHQQLL